ncbi:N-acetylmuramic acid 6-phosphate etherase [Balneolaceae bacterium YR4-1]|uniref:N-acetylmuramic acid 6-phosphate etherase n=1 Tax=Halalkalibaculum roseum TaxID=2709311 RepID=A0A6M1SZL8_9BACT|nr:N-acetylmuramic acid 6-phosphate etherase [Halalkalibaculum roseum]NGP76644.1 N-acetylmuramic acid 6-phosphate etherase [Halalkalibaculum roseum]
MEDKQHESNNLFEQLKKLDTEQRNPNTRSIDLADPKDIARLINEEDKLVAEQVGKRNDQIAKAISITAEALQEGGRLIYAGAGTSGRLGVLDAAECPPTFGTDPDKIIGLIAGGKEAMFVAQEGAEDFEENGRKAMDEISLSSKDIVCGLAASGRTPYVHGALREAKERGSKTFFVTTVPAEQITISVDVLIDVPVGPEVIMGSTRMKSATAQKMVLNMITTGAMIRQGKIYENVMVDLMLTNEKLKERAKRIIMMFADVSYNESEKLLEEAGGHVKTALLMALGELSKQEAKALLDQHDGFIRKAFLSLQG